MAATLPAFSFPHLPETPFKPILHRNCCVGGRVLLHASNLGLASDDKFKSACDTCDSLREQIRTKDEVPVAHAPNFGKYVALARKLTEGLDLSQIGVLIAYGKTVLPDLDFDVCCLGFNVVVGLLKGVSRLAVRSETGIPELTHPIKYSRTICDEVLRVYREPFQPVLTREMVNNLSAHVNAAFGYAMCLVALIKQDHNRSAAWAAWAAPVFAKLSPPQSAMATFLAIYADVQYFRGRAYPDEIGIAVSYGQHAIEQFEQLPKKFDPAMLAAIQNLMASFTPEFEEKKEKNWKMYFKPVPVYTQVPIPKTIKCPTADEIWAVPEGAASINELLRGKIAGQIDQRVRAVAEAAEPVIAGVDDRLAKVPTATIRELVNLVAEFNTQRTATRELAEEVARIFRAQPNLLGRFPALAQNWNQLQTALNSAANTDLTYETQYAQAKSIIENIERIAMGIEGTKQGLVEVWEKFNAAAAEVRAGKREKEQKMNDTEREARRAIQELQVAVAQIDHEFETKLQYYLATCQTVKSGLASAVGFYEKAGKRFQDVKTKISGLG